MIDGTLDGGEVMAVLGEIETGLLQNSTSLPAANCEHILALFRGERVRRFERPIAYAASPDLLTGVDCRLASASAAKVRGIGTVISRAAITGGHVLQASATIRLVRGRAGRRLPWSHYLARPGCVEAIGKADADDLARGFAVARRSTATLDLGAISTRVADAVQTSAGLDRAPPFRAARTTLRWAATFTDPVSEDAVRFGVEPGNVRTLMLDCDKEQAASVAEFCEDLALHDWLLSTLSRMVERSRIGADGQSRVVNTLSPAVDHLLHLWMPAARVDRSALPLWESLERRPGLSRQWRSLVDRVRDQIALSTITLLRANLGGATR